MTDEKKTTELLKSFSSDEESKSLIVSNAEICHYEKGSALVTVGSDAADGLYIIAEGSARVVDKDAKTTNLLREGDYFGELGLLGGKGRTASVIADSETVAVRIPNEVYQKAIAPDPKKQAALFSGLYENLSGRYEEIKRLSEARMKSVKMLLWCFLSFVFLFVIRELIPLGVSDNQSIIQRLLVSVSMIGLLFAVRIKPSDLGVNFTRKGWLTSFLGGLAFVVLWIIFNGVSGIYSFPLELGARYFFYILSVMTPIILICGFCTKALTEILPEKHNKLLALLFTGLLGIIMMLIFRGSHGEFRGGNLGLLIDIATGAIGYMGVGYVRLKSDNSYGMIAGMVFGLGCFYLLSLFI